MCLGISIDVFNFKSCEHFGFFIVVFFFFLLLRELYQNKMLKYASENTII